MIKTFSLKVFKEIFCSKAVEKCKNLLRIVSKELFHIICFRYELLKEDTIETYFRNAYLFLKSGGMKTKKNNSLARISDCLGSRLEKYKFIYRNSLLQ